MVDERGHRPDARSEREGGRANADTCWEFDRRDVGLNPARRAAWAAHVRWCATCREQDAADRALQALLGSTPRPELPPFFAQRCARLALGAAPARILGARERLVLRFYWALTLVVACGVLRRIDWPALTPAAESAAAVTLAAVLVPILLLACLGGGLSALLRRTLG